MSTSPAPSLSASNLQALALRKHEEFITKYPQFQTVFTPDSQLQSREDKVATNLEQSLQSLQPELEVTEVVRAELEHVFEKLIQAIQNPTLLEDIQLRLYLEQQVTDLLGIPISTDILGKQVPLWQGKLFALPHSKRTISDALEAHGQVLEAEMSPFRYELPTLMQQNTQVDPEQFAILYPAWLYPDYHHDPQHILQSLLNQQFLLINPVQKRMIVVQCIGELSPSYRYAFAASPEVIRQGRFWWPGQSGDCLCFALTHPTKTGVLYAG